jgi:hypothetical protein
MTRQLNGCGQCCAACQRRAQQHRPTPLPPHRARRRFTQQSSALFTGDSVVTSTDVTLARQMPTLRPPRRYPLSTRSSARRLRRKWRRVRPGGGGCAESMRRRLRLHRRALGGQQRDCGRVNSVSQLRARRPGSIAASQHSRPASPPRAPLSLRRALDRRRARTSGRHQARAHRSRQARCPAAAATRAQSRRRAARHATNGLQARARRGCGRCRRGSLRPDWDSRQQPRHRWRLQQLAALGFGAIAVQLTHQHRRFEHAPAPRLAAARG